MLVERIGDLMQTGMRSRSYRGRQAWALEPCKDKVEMIIVVRSWFILNELKKLGLKCRLIERLRFICKVDNIVYFESEVSKVLLLQ
jgi:hypothetical protein